MKGVEKSVFGSFFRICEFDSVVFCSLNKSRPYLREDDSRKDVDIIKIVPCGTTERGNTLFCYELLWREKNVR
jgi:hypothetical protein